MTDWIETTCPSCGGRATRETDTMPQWAGSSWYFLRYTDPHNDGALASREALDYWTPVDWYNGGMEHTTLHLLYSRFWHKFLFDIGVVPTREPYLKRTSHGMILGEDGQKMSKSRGNVINPGDIIGRIRARIRCVFISCSSATLKKPRRGHRTPSRGASASSTVFGICPKRTSRRRRKLFVRGQRIAPCTAQLKKSATTSRA